MKAHLDGPQMFKKGTSSVVPTTNLPQTFPHKNRAAGLLAICAALVVAVFSVSSQSLDRAEAVGLCENRLQHIRKLIKAGE